MLTEEQRESVRYASEWLGRSDDIGNQKHAARLRTLLAGAQPKGAGMQAQMIASRICSALEADKDDGYDLEAGLFGKALSALIRELAAMSLSDGAQEPVAQWQYRFFDGVKWVDWANCTELLVKHKDGRDDFQFRALFERAHPQPLPQTDVARDAKDAKRYRLLRERYFTRADNPNTAAYHCVGVFTSWMHAPTIDREGLDAVLDAEIERLDRTKDE